MKKIILSLALIAAVATAGYLASTSAFFSDTETSSGNTFTAGSIDLKVDSNCTYNGQPSDECGTWGQTEGLDITNEKFFNFSDIKPGDWGENTISLHVVDNDAYVCVAIIPTNNAENGLTEPEQEMGDDYSPEWPWNGELADNLQFFAWADDGNNVYEPQKGEQPLFSNIYGPASDLLPNGKVYDLGQFDGGSTEYIGMAWCAGTMTVDSATGAINCDGSSMGNDSQSDSFKANIVFHVEQARHNENFNCDNWDILPQ